MLALISVSKIRQLPSQMKPMRQKLPLKSGLLTDCIIRIVCVLQTITNLTRQLWELPLTRPILYSMPVIATSIPVLLLIAYAPKLSLRLGQNGCDLSGNFMIPYTSSVWDATHFFTVTIPLTSCWTQPGALYCKTYSFAEVKVIDLTWDLVVGRGGQAVLVVIAYRLFSSIIRMLMNRGEVGYDMFSTITFNTGDLSSLATLVRHALGCTPIPRTKHAVFTYWAMTLITLYIMGMPTLFSAMTAYTPNYFPSVTIPHKNGSTLTDCGYTLLPAWGAVQDQNVRGITWHSQVIPLLPAWVGNYYMTPKWIDCTYLIRT